MSAISKTQEDIRRLSERDFAEHQITELSRNGVFRTWRCGSQESSISSFMITTVPYALFLRGDIGDIIVERAFDMLPWCRRSVDSIDYFASKVPYALPTKGYSVEKVKEYLAERRAELMDEDETDGKVRHRLLDVLREAENDLASGEHADQHMYSVTSELWEGSDAPDFMDWNNNFLWCHAAIKWFVTHHNEPEIRE